MSNRFFLTGIVLLLSLLSTQTLAVQYRVLIIGDGLAYSINAVNSQGVGVGQTVDTGGQIQAYFWDGKTNYMGLLGCPYINAHACSSNAFDVNDQHTIVGETHSFSNYYKTAFIYTPTGGMQVLRNVGDEWSVATAVNSNNHVVGYGRSTYADYSYQTVAYLHLDANNVIRITGPLRESFAHDLNDLDNVVGCADTATGKHAFFWSASTSRLQDIGTLGGATSCAYGINNANTVVGSADNMHGKSRAFSWTETGGIKDLGTLDGKSYATDISPNGTTVGYYETPYRRYWVQNRGFVVINGVMQDLTSMLLPGSGSIVVEKATAISNNNIIAASGKVSGRKAMMLLYPMP